MTVGGLDIGTSGCKIALYNENAELLDTYYTEYGVSRKNGRHEIDFCDVRSGVLSLLRQAAEKHRIDALGVTSFGETFALLDENDNILAPSMLYTDPRGAEECRLLCEALEEEHISALTGTRPHPMYSISKIMWLKNNLSDAFKRAKRILLGEDYIIYLLTGSAQIDYSLAARTGAFDIRNKCWCKEIFKAAGVDISLMSKPVPAGSYAGSIKEEIKRALGISYDIKIINGCHDQVAAMFGAGVLESDRVMDGIGTVECIPAVLNEAPQSFDFYRDGYSVVPFYNNKYACYALSFTGGAVLKWFRDSFAEQECETALKNGESVYALLDKKAPHTPSGILVLPHFAGAATPYMDSAAKAAFAGITLETTKYDIYRALMEGTSYEMRVNLERMESVSGRVNEIRATGGGAASDIWLQIKADILGKAVTALDAPQVGAAGTAALAGVTLGIYSDIETAAEKMSPVRRVFYPNPENAEIYSGYYKKYAGLYSAIKGLGGI